MICTGCREPHQPADCDDARRPADAQRSCCCQHKPYTKAPAAPATEPGPEQAEAGGESEEMGPSRSRSRG